MSYSIVFTKTAVGDLNNIVDYISQDSHSRAIEFSNKIQKEIMLLAQFPNIGVTPKNYSFKARDCKCLIIGNYAVIYFVNQEAQRVEVRRILNCSMLHGVVDVGQIEMHNQIMLGKISSDNGELLDDPSTINELKDKYIK